MEKTSDKLIGLIEKIRPHIPVILLFVVVIIVFSGSVVRFMSSQGHICSRCHEIKERVVSLQESSHKSISCTACHEEPDYLSLLTIQLKAGKNYIEWLFGSYGKPLTSSVKNKACLNCHAKDIESTMTGKSIRISHKELDIRSCTACHSGIAHEIKGRIRNHPSMATCMECHNCTEKDNCSTCHTTEVPNRVASNKDAWKLAHGENWQNTHGMGNQKTCTACHTAEMCVKCHDTEVPHPQPWSFLHSASAKQNIASCYRCHKRSYCLDCHRLPMPHPEGFLKKHANIVEDVGNDVCWRCHMQDTCTPCHVQATHPNTKKMKFKNQ